MAVAGHEGGSWVNYNCQEVLRVILEFPFVFSFFFKIQCWNSSCEVQKVNFDSRTRSVHIGPRKWLLLREVRSKLTNFLQRVSERLPIVFLPFEVNEMFGFD